MPYDYDNKGNTRYAIFNSETIIKNNYFTKNYKGTKKPIFFICTKDVLTYDIIEILVIYINLLMKINPKMKYHEVRKNNTFIVHLFIKSFIIHFFLGSSKSKLNNLLSNN